MRPAPPVARISLPPGVVALGCVSLLMDTSSELVHSLLPTFMLSVLGASMVGIGLLEGIAEATAAITRVFSGALSDRWRRRKGLVVLGYGLAALSKPLFPLADSLATVLGARFLDRLGKGIRGAPRDALLADITPGPQRAAAYGLRQSLDSIGALLGPLLALGLLLIWADDLRAALAIAVIPAGMAVLLLVLGVREGPPAPVSKEPPREQSGARLEWGAALHLGKRYWQVVAFGGVLTLARFSEAFLLLRAQDLGLAVPWIPAVMVLMNGVYAATAYPAGLAVTRLGTRALLMAGLVALLAADLVLATATATWEAFLGTALWGLHLGLTQGLLAALVAGAAPSDRRGTAFGILNLVTGVLLLVASTLAGALWSAWGPAATFGAGAAFALIALLGLARAGR